jgi:hypothetical protein
MNSFRKTAGLGSGFRNKALLDFTEAEWLILPWSYILRSNSAPGYTIFPAAELGDEANSRI